MAPDPVTLSSGHAGLEAWAKSVGAERRASVKQPSEVVGRYKVLVNHEMFAQVRLIVEPSSDWIVQLEVAPDERRQLEEGHYLDQIVYGLLDVLMSEWTYSPLLNIRVRIVGVQVDPIRSSQAAFRRAARDAARQLLKLARS